MLSATMETKAIGLETSVVSLARLFWRGRILANLPIPFMARYVISKIELVNQRAAEINLQLADMDAHFAKIQDEIIDPDLVLRDQFQVVKQDLFALRKEILDTLLIVERTKQNALIRVMKRSVALTSEACELVNAIQWRIAEHDADLATRHEGYVAHSKDEVFSVLDRIAAGT